MNEDKKTCLLSLAITLIGTLILLCLLVSCKGPPYSDRLRREAERGIFVDQYMLDLNGHNIYTGEGRCREDHR